MSKIYVISDTHFDHENILKFLDKDGNKFRGELFQNAKEMNEAIIRNWNNIVKPEDHVYHLGDVYFGSSERADNILSRLVGKKRLILGNHDDGKDPVLQKHFQKILMWRKWPEFNCILSHCPLHISSLYGKTLFNVHGHIHEKVIKHNSYINVSVEQIGYTPILLETLIASRPTPKAVDLDQISQLME